MFTANDATAAANPDTQSTATPSTSEPAEGYDYAEVAALIGEYGYDYDDTLAEVTLTVADWVAALRTTEVAQATHYLRVDDGYCCLGLACELSGAGAWGIPSGMPDDDDDGYEYVYLVGAPVGDMPLVSRDAGPTGHLPEVIRGALGLRTNLGAFWATPEWVAALAERAPEVAEKVNALIHTNPGQTLESVTTTLSGLNDSGLTFAEIAEVIDSNPPFLFER